VKIKKSEKDWLLIKERDAYVRQPGDVFPEQSVLSGLTVEEVKSGQTHASTVRKALQETDVPRTRLDPTATPVMLAEQADDAFTRDGWLFELKLDGYRLLACKRGGEALLLTRNGNDYTEVFPEIARAVKALPLDSCIIDGEVVVLDSGGIPRFSLLQQRGRISSPLDIRRAAVELPAVFYVFDLLSFEDFDVRPLPLTRRKELLAQLIPKLGALRYLDHIPRDGDAFLKQVTALGLEGVIAKKADAPYHGGRTNKWLKIKAEKTGDFVIVGFTEPNGSRPGFGALQLADYVDGALVYAGRAGTGFTDGLLRELRAMLDPLVRRDPACHGPVLSPGAEPLRSDQLPETRTTTWTEPVHVVEVRFREWTPDGVLRHPAFVRIRTDKRPHDCERQGWGAAPEAPPVAEPTPNADNGSGTRRAGDASPAAEAPPPLRPVQKTVTISNPNKVFWPEEKYTKGDLIAYYKAISRWILPYLRNRPLVLTRFPDGIDGKSFYQKDAPEFAPNWIRTIPIWSNDTQRDIRYFVCDDEESLIYIANLGAIPLHIWASRVGSLEQPDWCVIDLDPKEAPFSDVIRCAQVLHRICESVGLPNYVKTTGKTGLHIMVPLGRQMTYAQSRTLGELLARLVIRELGGIATITRHVTRRGDKVYLDYLQNRHGQLIVAPFIVRPLAGATVSMPLVWDEVDSSLDPRAFTIKTALDHMETLGTDPMLPVLEQAPDLATVLAKLAESMKGE
jgi:bifunctional non-homologous end joining protein LigD